MSSNTLESQIESSLVELPSDHIVVALRGRTGHGHLGWRKPGRAERVKAAVLLASDALLRDDLTLGERAVLSPPRQTSGAARVLEAVSQLDRDPALLDGRQILADIEAGEKVLGWLAAAQAARIARLAEPGCAGDPTDLAFAVAQLDPDTIGPDHDGPSSECFVLAGIQQAVAHLGAVLCVSALSAGYRISDAQDLIDNLGPVHQALADGKIDPARARILQQRTKTLAHDDRLSVVDRLLPQALRHNPGRFSSMVDAAVLDADPDAAEARRQEAVDRRGLRCAPSEDGMARFIATLPATEAQLAWDLFDSIAQALKGFDDRCAAHRRADAFTTMIELLAAGHAVSAQSLLDQVLTAECSCNASDSDAGAELRSHGDDSSEDAPGDTHGVAGGTNLADNGADDTALHKTVGAAGDAADHDTADASKTTAAVVADDAADHNAAGHNTADAAGCTIDGIEPEADGGAGSEARDCRSADADAAADREGSGGAASGTVSCGSASSAKTWSLPTKQGRRTHATITVPWDVFNRFGATIAELSGYGMIPAAWARTLMEAAATVTLLVTDPTTGQAAAVGDRTYRPTQDVRDKVVTAYPCCIFTGCSTHAENCDCEHCKAFNKKHPELGGPTNIENLFPVCRLHHRLKTFGGWTYQRTADGIEVTSPLGTTTTTRPVIPTVRPGSVDHPPPF